MKKILIMLIILAVPAAYAFAQDKPAEPKKAEKDKTVQEYIADLDSKDEDVVVAAEKKLGEKTEKDAAKKLLELCKGDKRDRVRMYAAVALGYIAEKNTAEELSSFVANEPSADVRYAQVLALSRIGVESKKAVDNLLAIKDKETDPFIKDYVIKLEQKFKGK